MKLPVYVDNNATTPVDPKVLEVMLPYYTEKFGNSASRNHAFGWEAEEAVDIAREQIAKLVGAKENEIIFTSGATESDNLALKGVAEMYKDKGNHIITCVVEHKAILDTAKHLEKQGIEITYLPVDEFGMVSLEDIKNAVKNNTILISIMAANNELGTINPIKEIGAFAKEKGILFHTDATQAIGKIPIDVNDMGIDLLSMSSHKIYGPKGVGALYVRRRNPRVRVAPIIDGGGHERGMRSGTLNVPAIAGFGKACELARLEMAEESVRLRELRDRLWEGISSKLDEVYLNGHPELRLPNTLNVTFMYVEGEAFMMGANTVAVSSGSACTSATLEPSYVLKAIGLGDDRAHSSIRFSLGRFNTVEEIDYIVEEVVKTTNRLREMSPLYEMVKEGINLNEVAWQEH